MARLAGLQMAVGTGFEGGPRKGRVRSGRKISLSRRWIRGCLEGRGPGTTRPCRAIAAEA
jgi:hypothetical protein